MENFKKIEPEDFGANAFTKIGKEWMLIMAEKDGKANAMTASWGGLGVLWSKNVAFVFIRQSRYTKEFVDAGENFSLVFLPHEKNAKVLGYFGSVSGRTEDKIAKSGLSLAHKDGIPYFAEAGEVLFCKKLSASVISPENFLEKSLLDEFYGDGDLHTMYVAEITGIYQHI